MAYLGLVPSEHSSGSTVRRGGITKAGNALARRVLIEGAWTYRMQARVSRKLHDRIEQSAAGDPRHRLEGAAAPVRALSAPGRGRQAQGRGDHGDRARDGRLHLGDRPPRPATTSDRVTGLASEGDRSASAHLVSEAPGGRQGPVGEPSSPVMSRPPADARPLERGSPETKPRSCGSQPAHESLFNRRLTPRRPPGVSPLPHLRHLPETHSAAQGLDRC